MADEGGPGEHAVLHREALHGEEAMVLGQPHEQGERQQPRIPLFPLKSFLENFSGLAVSDGRSVRSESECALEILVVEQLSGDALPPGTGCFTHEYLLIQVNRAILVSVGPLHQVLERVGVVRHVLASQRFVRHPLEPVLSSLALHGFFRADHPVP